MGAMRVFGDRDVHGTGYLTIKQLREVIYSLAGPEGTDERRVEQILKAADRERTGRVPYDFFIRALFGTPPVLEYHRRVRRRSWLQVLCGCGKAPGAGGADDDSDSDDEARL